MRDRRYAIAAMSQNGNGSLRIMRPPAAPCDPAVFAASIAIASRICKRDCVRTRANNRPDGCYFQESKCLELYMQQP